MPPRFFFFHLHLSRRELGSDGRSTIIKDIYGSGQDQVWIKSTPSQILCLCLTLHKGPRAVGSSPVYLQTKLWLQHLKVQDTHPISAKIRGKKLPAQMVQACRFPLRWREWKSSGPVTEVVPASICPLSSSYVCCRQHWGNPGNRTLRTHSDLSIQWPQLDFSSINLTFSLFKYSIIFSNILLILSEIFLYLPYLP